MGYLFTGAEVFADGGFSRRELAIEGGRIVSVSRLSAGFQTVSCKDCMIVPGFVDVHVHLREPGFSTKETIATGTAAAAAGGYTAVCSMPNLNPVPDSMEHLRPQLETIDRDAVIAVHPYGAITRGEGGEALSDMAALSPYVVGFSDDGRGVQSAARMAEAMGEAKRLDKPIVAHCEDNSLLHGGCIHEGRWAEEHGFVGISSASEWRQIERDLQLVAEIGCRYHVCHISTKESVALIRAAKQRGLPVTCETAPHYLALCEDDLRDEGRFKMNPPLRSCADRDALREGLQDGTIDVIATDHAPHTAAEKAKGLRDSAMGIVGLETAFSVLYTTLVEGGILSLPVLVDKMALAPRRIFRLPGGSLEEGQPADFTVLNLHAPHTIDPDRFLSQGRATPFAGCTVSAAVEQTICGGKQVYPGKEQL
ncbi:MAG: dihydroorotase [Oscillospiraceae bacterium]